MQLETPYVTLNTTLLKLARRLDTTRQTSTTPCQKSLLLDLLVPVLAVCLPLSLSLVIRLLKLILRLWLLHREERTFEHTQDIREGSLD